MRSLPTLGLIFHRLKFFHRSKISDCLKFYRSHKIPLRLLLVLPLTLQTLIAVGLTGFLSFQSGQQAVNEVTAQLREEVSIHIHQKLVAHLALPALLTQSTADAVQLGLLDLQNTQLIGSYFWKQLQLAEHATDIYFGNEQNQYIHLERLQQGGIEIGTVSSEAGNDVLTYAINEQGDRTHLIRSDKTFHPRSHPWYTAAMEAEKPTWSKPRPSAKYPGKLVITLAQPIYDRAGKSQGVLAIDCLIDQFGEFLSRLQHSKSGQSFVMERSGLLVSSSTESPPANAEQQAVQSRDPLIRLTVEQLKQRFGDFHQISSNQQFQFSWNGDRQFVQVTPFANKQGLDWLIVVVIPESDFMGQISANIHTTVFLCLIALNVAVGLGIFMSRRIANPILLLNEASRKIAQGEFSQQVSSESIDELAMLAQSFNQMSQEIQQSRQQLEEYSRSLEQKVRERTQELEQEVRKCSTTEAVLQAANQELQRMAFIDGLTQVANRRQFDKCLTQEWWRLKRGQVPLSLILCDVDFFKQYNDTYGHQVGDECLCRVANAIRTVVKRPADLVARYGGEEFVIILPNTPLIGAIQVAYEIQAAIQRLQLPHQSSKNGPYVTLSIGVASVVPKAGLSPTQLVATADRALYQAKVEGRDRIIADEIDLRNNKLPHD